MMIVILQINGKKSHIICLVLTSVTLITLTGWQETRLQNFMGAGLRMTSDGEMTHRCGYCAAISTGENGGHQNGNRFNLRLSLSDELLRAAKTGVLRV